jgi:hypothetical protein
MFSIAYKVSREAANTLLLYRLKSRESVIEHSYTTKLIEWIKDPIPDKSIVEKYGTEIHNFILPKSFLNLIVLKLYGL